ncbi:MAG: tRNA (adenosine(37)-N6)-dimethylallyltransferase MiaA [Ignavibacteriales bacterium]|nr:MAG: tRNA (adenosine(37)-N6)-dimethylallyltransferase MiaA [Ignavibacteriales bacterium]
MNYNLITILGPTAVGKTHLAAQLANRFNGEIISADSRQVYRGMDIGTGKDISDYNIDGKIIPHHLIDVIEPKEEFNLFLFNKFFYESFSNLTSRGKIPFLVGGTGLYLHSILNSYELNKVDFDEARFKELDEYEIADLRERLKKINPSLHNTTDLLVKERVIRAIIIAEKENDKELLNKSNVNSFTIGIRLDREEIKKRITVRLQHRVQNGMIEEIKKLIDEGISFERLNLFGLEYKFIGKYLSGELSYNDMYQKLNSAIHSFAKRQMTWFRKMEREGTIIHWIEGPSYREADQIISQHFS